MFFAAFVSRHVCVAPQSLQVHALIRKSALPFGLLIGIFPQHEQVWVVCDSLTTSKTQPAWSLLYSNCVFNIPQPASKTDFASLVFAKPSELTLPMKIAAFSLTSLRLYLCRVSALRFLIFAWIAFTRCLFLARWAMPSFCSNARYSRPVIL